MSVRRYQLEAFTDIFNRDVFVFHRKVLGLWIESERFFSVNDAMDFAKYLEKKGYYVAINENVKQYK